MTEHTEAPLDPPRPDAIDSAPPVGAAVPPRPTGVPAHDSPRGGGRWPRVALGILLASALLAGGVYGFMRFDRVRVAQAKLDEATALLDRAEPDLLVVDDACQAGIASDIATRAAEALTLVDTVSRDTTEAVSLLESAMTGLPEDLLPLAAALREGAAARYGMMVEAPAILSADIEAAAAITRPWPRSQPPRTRSRGAWQRSTGTTPRA